MYVHTCRSIGVVNFGVEYLREMMKARPNNVPAGVCRVLATYIANSCSP